MIRILIADDDPVCLHELEAILSEWGYWPVVRQDGDAAWEVLCREDSPRLAILDWLMPGMEGPEICRRLRQTEKNRHTQVILLTVRGEKRDIVAGIDAGADDYITKPFDHTELRARLTAAVRNLRVHEQLLEAQARIRQEATLDPLTGLPNRTAIMETLSQCLARGVREGTPVGAALIDLDRFKSVNDNLGHLAGDEALREVVRRMRQNLRPYDHLGRYGGDEFLLVVPGLDVDGAATMADRLRLAVCRSPVVVGRSEVHQTITVGVMSFCGDVAPRCENMVGAADRALLQAKRSQRNSVGVWQEDGQTAPEKAGLPCRR